MRPSTLGAATGPWRPLLGLAVLLLAARPGARAQGTIENNFGELYRVGEATEHCLDEAASGCSGSTGKELNGCLCLRDRFALEAARCIARVKPGDLDDVYFQMRANCLETGGYTLVVDQAAWDRAVEAATATTSSSTSTTTSRSTSTPTATSTTAEASPTADDVTTTVNSPADTGRATVAATSTPTAAAAAAGGLDTGGKIGVGVAVAVGAILVAAGVFIWLKWRKRQREGPRYSDRDAHIMEASDMVRTYPPSQAGPGGGAAMGAGMYHKPPVGTASTTTTSPIGQPSPELRGGGGGHWVPGAQPYHPHQQQYTGYPDHPSIAELGDGSDVTSHALSARNSARYSELPGGQSPLYPPPSSPSPVSPGPSPNPNMSPPLHNSGGGGPQPGARG